MILLNPKQYEPRGLDSHSAALMRKVIGFFEAKGKRQLKHDDNARAWYADFLDFVKREKLFATFLTPAAHAEGDPNVRWDTFRNCELNELTGFYGLAYWYTWQVSILGLGPLWMGENEALKRTTAKLLREGSIFAFGLSERAHGADLYSTEMTLTPKGDGFVANGEKYYIGNGNEAALVSTFGKIAGSGEYVFFAVDSKHKAYELKQNVVNMQSYVSEFALHDYPVTAADVLSCGTAAWDSALNTVNVGKFNLGWASIGICTHSLYEAMRHASNRVLYGKRVTDFPHVRRGLTDAYCRLVAMKAFSRRAADYFRVASATDRRYLLFNPLVKMKVTTQGEQVIDLLWDVIAAKGFEKDMVFEMSTRDIRALPKLEGTVAVNMALVVKFMRNYFFNPGEFADVPRMTAPKDDSFLFAQGATKGLSGIQFHDYAAAYKTVSLPNVELFKEQIEVFKDFLVASASDPAAVTAQSKDIDFLLAMGEVFSLVAYGQLLIEYRNLEPGDVSDDLLDQMFDCFVRDVSGFAVQLYCKPTSTPAQMELCQKLLRKPAPNAARADRVFNEHVWPLRDAYEMTP